MSSAGRPCIVVLDPDPVVVAEPGYLVIVQVPLDGRPIRSTLPVATVHVGCVISSTTGGVGVGGCSGITTLDEGDEVHPYELVTVKV